MKRYYVIMMMLFAGTMANAKYVKFSVDMRSTDSVNSTGVHIAGDFQTVAGFAGGNYAPNTTSMFQEVADTNIYTVIVNIPAFAKYEYYFINGDQSYEAEYVPLESRVIFGFDSNRWLYVDSLADDTTFVGVLPFAGNAPAGKHLLRFKVDMQNEASIDPNGVHVATSFDIWSTTKNHLYSFDGLVYEYIAYVDTAIALHNHRYINGNTIAGYENVPNACNVFNNRETQVMSDTVLDVVCFSSCSACTPVGIAESASLKNLALYPNPTDTYSTLEFNDNSNEHQVTVANVLGEVVRNYSNYTGNNLRIEKNDLSKGVYFVTVLSGENTLMKTRLIIE